MNSLEHKFTDRGEIRGNSLLLAASDAIDLIEAAKSKDILILGIDCFHITNSDTCPLLEHILDLTSEAVTEDTWTDARKFVEARSDREMMFEVVLDPNAA